MTLEAIQKRSIVGGAIAWFHASGINCQFHPKLGNGYLGFPSFVSQTVLLTTEGEIKRRGISGKYAQE